MFKIILAILIFSVIVIFHELGHYLLAKKNGVCVEEFAIGIGPTLYGIQKGETRYSIKVLPFGGCCMMLGEDGENKDPRSLNAKSAVARFSIIFAGPFFNFILAFFLSLFVIGMSGADPAILSHVDTDSGAYEAGIRDGDTITKINHSHIYNFREITLYNYMNNEKADVAVTYKRDGKSYDTIVTRKKNEAGYYILGVTRVKSVKQNILGVVKYSLLEVRYQIKTVFVSLKYMLMGHASMQDMSGPVGIVSMMGDSYEESIVYGIKTAFLTMMNFAILLSANLGVMNLLPFPALDGGRLVFILVEMVRGKKIDPEKEGMVHLAGLAVLMAFMVFVMFNDIRNLF